jgi:hypothetical protein
MIAHMKPTLIQYYQDTFVQNTLADEPIPHDKEKEKWKQCRTCGLIVPIYETKIE